MSETIVVGGGCFWCIEAILNSLRGVEKVVSGYAGGEVADPTYAQVCSGTSGHAEVVAVTFDPAEISLHDLLTIFFTLHDPTTLNRQGADVGTQYRSVVHYATPEQLAAAEAVIAELTEQKIYPDPIVTTLEPLDKFYPAEQYHQDYYERNASQPYCMIVIQPKVLKLRKLYQDRLKSV